MSTANVKLARGVCVCVCVCVCEGICEGRSGGKKGGMCVVTKTAHFSSPQTRNGSLQLHEIW